MQISYLVFIHVNEYNPIIRQKISRQHQSGINHTAPVGMKASVGVGILEQAVFVLVVHSHLFIFFFLCAHEIVSIYEVVAGIIRRIDIDHFDLAEIALLQNFQDFQIVALDIEIFRGVPVAAVRFNRAQRFGDRP